MIICIYVCVYIYIYTHTYVCIYIYTLLHINVERERDTYTYIERYIEREIDTHTYTCPCAYRIPRYNLCRYCGCVYIYIYIYIYSNGYMFVWLCLCCYNEYTSTYSTTMLRLYALHVLSVCVCARLCVYVNCKLYVYTLFSALSLLCCLLVDSHSWAYTYIYI